MWHKQGLIFLQRPIQATLQVVECDTEWARRVTQIVPLPNTQIHKYTNTQIHKRLCGVTQNALVVWHRLSLGLSPASTPCDADCHRFPSFFSETAESVRILFGSCLQMFHVCTFEAWSLQGAQFEAWYTVEKSLVHNGLITTPCLCHASLALCSQ